MKIGEALELRQEFLGSRLYGFEWELEEAGGINRPLVEGLTHTHDGSLRGNGVELITPPLKYTGLAEYFSNLDRALGHPLSQHKSHRTSMHIHVNVANLTDTELYKVFVVCMAYDTILTEHTAPERKNNNFAAQLLLQDRARSALCKRGEVTFRRALRDSGRYNSISFWNVYNVNERKRRRPLGTVEFRSFELPDTFSASMDALTYIRRMFLVAKKINERDNLSILKNVARNYHKYLAQIFKQEVQADVAFAEHSFFTAAAAASRNYRG